VVAVPEGLPLAVTLTYESPTCTIQSIFQGCDYLRQFFQACIFYEKDDARQSTGKTTFLLKIFRLAF
jgi:hypothetical protein